MLVTGKFLSEALIFASINPQYDNRLFMKFLCKLQGQNMGRKWAEHVLPMFCACSFQGNSINNILSYFGLVDARISASEKDLPVRVKSFVICFYLGWSRSILQFRQNITKVGSKS
jgi:hypothetical protein